MNAYEKNGVFHCDCGFSWLRGKSGNHDCADGLREKVKQLAAENAALKRVPETDSVAMLLALDSFRSESLPDVGLQKAFESLMYHRKTPATDRIVAGIKADGRAEGINFAASRLAAAFNHGFVDKPMAEVFDVVRMILTAKEDLANDPVLAADGLSGEYAEKSLAEWEAELREGADK